jgi:hypothetical protein
VCDRYESQLDKIAKGVPLAEFAIATAEAQLERFPNDLAAFRMYEERTTENRNDLAGAFAIEKDLITQKGDRFVEVAKQTAPVDPQPSIDQAIINTPIYKLASITAETAFFDIFNNINDKTYNKGYKALLKMNNMNHQNVVKLLLQVATGQHDKLYYFEDSKMSEMVCHWDDFKILMFKMVVSRTTDEQYDVIEAELKKILSTDDIKTAVVPKEWADLKFYVDCLVKAINWGRAENLVISTVLASNFEIQTNR